MERKLPEGWKRVKLGNIVKFEYGKSLPTKERNIEGTIPVYGSNGIVGYHSDFLIDGPSLIVGRKGSIGEVHLSNGPCWPIDTTYFINIDNNLDIKYLYYIMKTLRLNSLNRSTAIPGLNRNDAYSIEVCLPPLETQRRIVAILSKAEETRRLRAQADELAMGLIQSIFLEIFGDPATNPRGWDTLGLKDISEKFGDGPFGSNLKTEHYTDDGIRVIRLQNIGVAKFINDDQAYISEEHFSTLRKHTCNPGDILIGTMGDPNLRACMLPKFITLAINKADCVQCRPDQDIVLPEYICHLLNLPSIVSVASKLVHGETRGRISSGQLGNLSIPIPPISFQKRFTHIIETADKMMSNQLLSKIEIQKTFDSLLQKAFTGELIA